MGMIAFRLGYGRYGIIDADNPTGGINVTYGAPTTATLTRSAINFSSTGNNTLIAGIALQTVRVHKLFFVANADTTITFKNGTGTDLSGPMPIVANGSLTLDLDGEPWFITSAGNGFVISQSGTAQISGCVYYSQS